MFRLNFQIAVSGRGLLPLYPTVRRAAIDDPKRYELLAMFDAPQIGQARERDLAIRLLEERLHR